MLSTFGLKRGVDVDTLSESFARLHLNAQIDCSPNAIHPILQTLETTAIATAQTWEQDAVVAREV